MNKLQLLYSHRLKILQERGVEMNPSVIEDYRIKKGLKPIDVTKKLNKTPGWYSKFKKGKVPLKAQYFEPLSELFGVKPERLAKEYFSGKQLEDTSNTDHG